ncbi:MAG: DUF928 domain-containing protein [Moorea sp. SIO2B7]|nr:DUF928 domain-containing protein [Moorena sp. SIO2B7]
MLNNQRLLNLITVGLLVLGTVPTIAQPIAQPATNPSKTTHSKLPRVFFNPPSDDKKPTKTSGAGSRDGQCSQNAIPTTEANSSSTQGYLMSLVPTTNFGLTIAEHPTLWIYLPETSARQLVLSIMEQGTKHHSQTFVSITGDSGIISLQPSPDSPSLEIGKAYELVVMLVCEQRPSLNDPRISSWISRISLPQPKNQGTVLEQAAWYAEQGIWYDALDTLVQARRSQPNNQDLMNIWAEFLDSGGLKEIATEPLVFLPAAK